MVRVHGLLSFVAGLLFGMSTGVVTSYTNDVVFWYYLPPILVYLSALSIVFVRKGHSVDAFQSPGPEAALAFFYRSPLVIRRFMMASAVLAFGSFVLAFFIVITHNGDPNLAIFMLHEMLTVLGYVILAVATIFDLSDDQDPLYGSG